MIIMNIPCDIELMTYYDIKIDGWRIVNDRWQGINNGMWVLTCRANKTQIFNFLVQLFFRCSRIPVHRLQVIKMGFQCNLIQLLTWMLLLLGFVFITSINSVMNNYNAILLCCAIQSGGERGPKAIFGSRFSTNTFYNIF